MVDVSRSPGLTAGSLTGAPVGISTLAEEMSVSADVLNPVADADIAAFRKLIPAKFDA
jgi:hypothetical protein